MTTPHVPLRLEFSVEVPGTPEQVWDAIATAHGITAWMMPTELEEREGGAVVFHMGPDSSSEGTVVRWDPPHRLVYEEPGWAELVDQDPTTVTPLASEFLVEATSGGTCVVKVVSSAFGSGADWEREFFDEMAKGWMPMFDHLRLYLTHFPGQRVTPFEAIVDVTTDPATAVATIRGALGVEEAGSPVSVLGAKAEVERIGDDNVLLRLTEPVPGLVSFFAYQPPDATQVRLGGYLFSDDAPAYVEREALAWQGWLEDVLSSSVVR
jgi:uncharacterized protein YndB with AHSA1/START domain